MKLEVEPVRLQTKHPFRIARGVETEVEVFVFRLTSEGVTGLGEAAPPPYYGETSETVRKKQK